MKILLEITSINEYSVFFNRLNALLKEQTTDGKITSWIVSEGEKEKVVGEFIEEVKVA
jgi:hypothetical protein